MINQKTDFFLCTVCFNAGDSPPVCHDRPMIHYAGHNYEQRKPPMDGNGRLLNRAPVWFLNAQTDYSFSHISMN